MQDEGRTRFEAEVVPYWEAAYRVALSLTRQPADAEDLVQESCLRAYRGVGGLRPGSNARAWLLTIVRHTFANLRRQAAVRPKMVRLPELVASGCMAEPMDTATPDPEEHVVRTLERERLLRALAALPEPYRSVVVLVDLEQLRYAEAAAVLRCPRGTIMSRLHRGRLLLAERLGQGAAAGDGERAAGSSRQRARSGQ